MADERKCWAAFWSSWLLCGASVIAIPHKMLVDSTPGVIRLNAISEQKLSAENHAMAHWIRCFLKHAIACCWYVSVTINGVTECVMASSTSCAVLQSCVGTLSFQAMLCSISSRHALSRISSFLTIRCRWHIRQRGSFISWTLRQVVCSISDTLLANDLELLSLSCDDCRIVSMRFKVLFRSLICCISIFEKRA